MSSAENYRIDVVYPSARVAELSGDAGPLYRVIDVRTERTVPFGQYSEERRARERLRREVERPRV